MKFLNMIKGGGGTPSQAEPLGAFKAAREYINELLADGTLDCAYAFPDGNGACIVNVDSHEELRERVAAYPFSSTAQFEIYPLVDISHYFNNVIEALESGAGG